MRLNKILIVSKQTKYEYEKEKFKLIDEQLAQKYSAERTKWTAIIESHKRQAEAKQFLRKKFPAANLISINDLKQQITGYDAVISFGGDNSFTYTSHYVGNTPIIGINSDPETSIGALCAWTVKDLAILPPKLRQKKYKIEKWPRLETKIDGQKIMPAISEYFFGEKQRNQMSRHTIIYRGKQYEQKSSGIIITTGAGSTGWYSSASQYHEPELKPFAKTEKKAAFVVSEPYTHKQEQKLHSGELREGEELTLHSLNDSQGFASADSWTEHDFSKGKKATIGISKQPLRVIVPN